jgi:hypothetical protein
MERFGSGRRDFRERFTEAGQILRLPAEELFSIKLRPLIERQNGEEANLYLSPSEYEPMEQAVKASVPARKYGNACQGTVWVCKLDGGMPCLFVEHETGPEIICHEIILIAGAVTSTAGAVAASAIAANQVVKLVNNIAKALRGSGGRQRDSKGRFIAVSVEKRLATTQRIVRQIGKTAKATEKAIENIKELFN